MIPASAFNGNNVLTPLQAANLPQAHQQQTQQFEQKQSQSHQNALSQANAHQNQSVSWTIY